MPSLVHDGAMRRFVLIAILPAILLVGSCASTRQDAAAEVRDCTQQVRFHGVIYGGYGSTRQPGVDAGDALLAGCDDVGDAPPGAHFEDASTVDVVTFAGFSSSDVLGMKLPTGRTLIFVNDSLPDGARDDLLSALE